jgi:hypothetical protein
LTSGVSPTVSIIELYSLLLIMVGKWLYERKLPAHPDSKTWQALIAVLLRQAVIFP